MADRVKRCFIGLLAASLIGGCAARQSTAFGLMPTASSPQARSILPGQAWMDARASNSDLVYVSNGDGEITVYDYSSETLLGVLADFQNPMGECVDKNQNVYVVDAGEKKIFEYAHGGTTAIKTLNDSPYAPNECAADPITGDVAVANSKGSGNGGNIAVFPPQGGKARIHSDPNISTFLGCAFDSNGSLLATGYETGDYTARFAWLPKKGGKLVDIHVPGPKASWNWYVNGLEWDGQFFALNANDVYQIALIHGQAYYVGETTFGSQRYLSGNEYGIYDPDPKRQGTEILLGYEDEGYSSGVYYFPYPAGGGSDGFFSHGVYYPNAVVVSLGKSRGR